MVHSVKNLEYNSVTLSPKVSYKERHNNIAEIIDIGYFNNQMLPSYVNNRRYIKEVEVLSTEITSIL